MKDDYPQENPNQGVTQPPTTPQTVSTLLVSSFRITGPNRDFGHKITFEVGEDSSVEVAKLLMVSPETALRVRVEIV